MSQTAHTTFQDIKILWYPHSIDQKRSNFQHEGQIPHEETPKSMVQLNIIRGKHFKKLEMIKELFLNLNRIHLRVHYVQETAVTL